MIEGRTILCFASGYDAPPTSKHNVHILADRDKVASKQRLTEGAPHACSTVAAQNEETRSGELRRARSRTIVTSQT